MTGTKHTPGPWDGARGRTMSRKIYEAFSTDPNLHLRTDLGPYYRMGRAGIKRQGLNFKQRAAYLAGFRQWLRLLKENGNG